MVIYYFFLPWYVSVKREVVLNGHAVEMKKAVEKSQSGEYLAYTNFSGTK